MKWTTLLLVLATTLAASAEDKAITGQFLGCTVKSVSFSDGYFKIHYTDFEKTADQYLHGGAEIWVIDPKLSELPEKKITASLYFTPDDKYQFDTKRGITATVYATILDIGDGHQLRVGMGYFKYEEKLYLLFTSSTASRQPRETIENAILTLLNNLIKE